MRFRASVRAGVSAPVPAGAPAEARSSAGHGTGMTGYVTRNARTTTYTTASRGSGRLPRKDTV